MNTKKKLVVHFHSLKKCSSEICVGADAEAQSYGQFMSQAPEPSSVEPQEDSGLQYHLEYDPPAREVVARDAPRDGQVDPQLGGDEELPPLGGDLTPPREPEQARYPQRDRQPPDYYGYGRDLRPNYWT